MTTGRMMCVCFRPANSSLQDMELSPLFLLMAGGEDIDLGVALARTKRILISSHGLVAVARRGARRKVRDGCSSIASVSSSAQTPRASGRASRVRRQKQAHLFPAPPSPTPCLPIGVVSAPLKRIERMSAPPCSRPASKRHGSDFASKFISPPLTVLIVCRAGSDIVSIPIKLSDGNGIG